MVITKNNNTNFDYIIVGAGSAGCVLANRLSENPAIRVCLLEAGPKDTSPLIHMPIGVIGLMRSHRLNWQYNSQESESLNHRSIFNPRGKTLGGSSSINAMLYTRGQAEDYDEWQALGNEGWSYKDVLPYFKATQHQERGANAYHGINGELNVAEGRSNHPICQQFVMSAQNAGYPLNDDFNGERQYGVGPYQVTQKNGQRCSAAKAFLTPIKSRQNLTIITNALVEKLIIDDAKTVLGVQITVDGQQQELFAAKETLLSAGAYNSPQLLMLSGVGDPDALTQQGIKLKHPLSGVGKNLQDHVDALIVNTFNDKRVLSLSPSSLLHHSPALWDYYANRQGVLTSAVAEAGGFIGSTPETKRPDLQLHFIPGPMDDHGRNLKMLFNQGISLHVCLLRPKSRGSVTLASNSPSENPVITTNMLSHPDDVAIMVNGVKRAREILHTAPLANHIGEELFPGAGVVKDSDIQEFLKAKANTIYHPVGTCKMGSDDQSVVDSSLKVHGLQKLRVVDASIMPRLISGNTNAPTIMIAAKAADMILKQIQ